MRRALRITARQGSAALRRNFSSIVRQNSTATRVAVGTMMMGCAAGAASFAYCQPSEVEQTKSAIPVAVLSTDLKGLKKIYSGKVRDIYEVDGDAVLQVATDRLSSFDVVMTNGIPGKGKILTQLAVWWFEKLEREVGCPNHIITADVDKMPANVQVHADAIRGRCMLVTKLDMLPVEAIVRGYITGSGYKDYKATGHVCGIPLPKGLVDCQQIPGPVFTPSTKAEMGAHDENISFDKTIDLLGLKMANELSVQSLRYYNIAKEYCASRGIILADTKFEFGMDKQGRLVLADEIITPDCSRFWDASKYEAGRQQDSLDKQVVRNYLLSINYDKTTPVVIPDDVVEQTMNKYIEIFKILTGRDPDL